MIASAARAARADTRQCEAQQVITDLDLMNRWGTVGDVTVVGSVAIDVVVQPDIDLEIHCEDATVAGGFAVMAGLGELPGTRRIIYLDGRDRSDAGQYWKLEYEVSADITWTVDAWIFDRHSPHPRTSALVAAVRNAMTPELRDRVLAIKEDAVARGERAYGYWLYQAVLDHDVHDFDGYRTWLGDRNIYERTGWMPSTHVRQSP